MTFLYSATREGLMSNHRFSHDIECPHLAESARLVVAYISHH